MWRYYASHRKALFRVIKTLDFQSTTSDQALIEAMNFIMAHEQDPKKYLEATIDLSFASKKWLRTVMVRRKRKSWFIRRHLETCVFSHISEELKSGDLCMSGLEQFADYRSQLLSWEECEPKFATYCQQLDFPMTAEGFVEHLRTWLTEVAAEVDRTRPENHELIINEKGEPALKKLRAKEPPIGLAQLEEALQEKIPERHLLDVLARIDHVTGFTRHFGPLSGSEPKTPDARERHLLTIFAYGTHLGPHQMARHLRGQLSADQLAHLNRRHFTAAKRGANRPYRRLTARLLPLHRRAGPGTRETPHLAVCRPLASSMPYSGFAGADCNLDFIASSVVPRCRSHWSRFRIRRRSSRWRAA